MKRLAIVTTHPIQYYAPIFKLLSERNKILINVFYTLGDGSPSKFDHGFGKAISWDIPLLDGYLHTPVKNIAAQPGSHYFKGIVTPGLVNLIKEWEPDGILIIGWAYQSHLKVIRYFANKVPLYFRGDSTLLNEQKGLKGIFKAVFLKWVYKHIDHAFYVGKNNKAYFKKYGLKESELTFTPHAIDNERFTIGRKDEAIELRSSLKIDESDMLLLYAGKFEPVKNVELLLSAFIKLNKKNVHLLLVGNGVNEAMLKQQAKESSLAGNIHFIDFKNQSYMPVLYQSADLFCLPSKSETWGLAINEAMACSKAILASDKVGCAVDLVTKNNGAIFKSDDAEDLTRHLKQLTEIKAELDKMGQQSALIIKDWNFTNIAVAIENKLLNETY